MTGRAPPGPAHDDPAAAQARARPGPCTPRSTRHDCAALRHSDPASATSAAPPATLLRDRMPRYAPAPPLLEAPDNSAASFLRALNSNGLTLPVFSPSVCPISWCVDP